ncbi:UPF0047-domain-containing protein [Didymella exigua CBS 183.55]|uniref:UPF0047-domain-containing protein n=1 Tax=Didymella exigua CBS 183.55 TaxID=1150837 RepID=A0A6A5RD45_9PLEO|nr:UPF0047-domain-containing protein [Didymella exigua CBS 183.55]KAF1925024.1 UPF0047-domain-containing protein [Didymella exigua CBS 183.55]
MPQQHTSISPLATFLIATFFLLSLFPGTFIPILWAPYNSLAAYYFPAAAPRSTVLCSSPNICTAPLTMSWYVSKQFTLPSRSRGSYLITDTILKELPEIKNYKTGLLHLFIQHTSCALSLNENWDEDVRADMSTALDRIVPEDKKGQGLYLHDAEGSDDMPAHVKSALVGASVTIPITNGRLNTGTWQGIWYLEFRDMKHSRKIVATIQGEKN